MVERTGNGVYGHPLEGSSVSLYKNMLESFCLKYMQYKSAFMKLKLRVGHRNILVFALIARWLWKHFRLPKEHLHWYNSAKTH
jgi:hypothetical protein